MNLPYEVFVQILWTLFRKTFEFFQYFVWWWNGTHARIKENYKKDAIKGSVQVLNILARHKFCFLLQPSGADNFLMTHSEFVDPEYVLQDNITLYYINKDEAVFVEAEEGVDVTQSKHGSFVRYAQFKMARKVIIMPISAFNRLGEKVGQTKAKIIFLCNSARCGSTLVNQVFEETGSSIAYSEPDAFNAVVQLKGLVSEEERIRIFKNCINIMCKPCHTKEIKSYVLKPTQPTMVEMPLIKELFPDSHMMYIYRDGLKCSKSLAKICNELPMLGLTMAFGRRSAKFTRMSIEGMGLPADNFEVKLQSGIHFGSIVWSAAMREYLDFREKGIAIVGVRYEDLVDDTTYAYQKIFEYCNLPYDAKAVELAMGRDSQRGTNINMKTLAKHKQDEFTDDVKKATDEICDKFGLPHFPEPFIAPGTITYRDRSTPNGK